MRSIKKMFFPVLQDGGFPQFNIANNITESRLFAVLKENLHTALSPIAADKRASRFGVALDIDGVLLHGVSPIPRASESLNLLAEHEIPHVFLTNGGGIMESVKAQELTRILGVPVREGQVILGHTPFKYLVSSYAQKPVLAVGKHEPCQVLRHYGFSHPITVGDYVTQFPHIDPMASYKPWSNSTSRLNPNPNPNPSPVAAVFVVSDPVDWSQDLQVICDVLRSGGSPLSLHGPQPDLYFAADDFQFQGNFSVPRFGMGAFRIALSALYERLTGRDLEYVVVGKPLQSAFRVAELTLSQLVNGSQLQSNHAAVNPMQPRSIVPSQQDQIPADIGLDRIYMVGDNPLTDIRGAAMAGPRWRSILTRTGVHKKEGNHLVYPADKVVADIWEAVEYILEVEGSSG